MTEVDKANDKMVKVLKDIENIKKFHLGAVVKKIKGDGVSTATVLELNIPLNDMIPQFENSKAKILWSGNTTQIIKLSELEVVKSEISDCGYMAIHEADFPMEFGDYRNPIVFVQLLMWVDRMYPKYKYIDMITDTPFKPFIVLELKR
jgi:hypothetical protein